MVLAKRVLWRVYEKICRQLWGHPRERDKAGLQTLKAEDQGLLVPSLQVLL